MSKYSPCFEFQGLKEYCNGCAAFEPVDRPQRLGSGIVMHRIECEHADKCSTIKNHLERQIGSSTEGGIRK